jgi:hypothetical protein
MIVAGTIAVGLMPGVTTAAPSSQDVESEATITAPKPGATVSGVVNIVGNAVHPDINRYEILYAPGPRATESSKWISIGSASGVQVKEGTLTTWDTSTLAPGVYTLAISMWWGGGEQVIDFVEEITVEATEPASQLRPPAEPGQPVNLSRSGAASDVSVVEGPGDNLQVFWQDTFDGLMTAHYNGTAWTYPETALIMKPVEKLISHPDTEGTSSADRIVEREVTFEPVSAAPRIEGGPGGRAHAVWREPREEAPPALMHSALAFGSTTWSTPAPIQDTALMTDTAVGWDMAFVPGGVVHLAYVRTLHTDAYPAGVYYRRSADGGQTWSAPTVLYGSIYFRLRTEEDAHVRIATDAAAGVHVAWDDPRAEEAFYVRSPDGGASWTEPETLGTEEGARHPRVVTAPGGQVLLFWEAPGAAAACALYQQRSPDGGQTWEEPRQILEELTACPQRMTFLRTAQGQLIWAGHSADRGLALAAWDGERWSDLKWLDLGFEHPELEEQVYLESVHPLLLGGTLAVVGAGPYGDAWFMQSDVDVVDWAFAPPPPWTDPVTVSDDPQGTPELPAMAVDSDGGLHLLWGTSTAEALAGSALTYSRWASDRWSRPAPVLRSPEGSAREPALVAAGDRLHAVWSDPEEGAVFYSRAYVRDAYASGGWREPTRLPSPGVTASRPDILVDANGVLHVIYAVPLNQERGIYYTRSEDGGDSWADPVTVFDAEGAGWAMADHPALAMSPAGRLHAVWSRGAVGGPFPPEAVVYARSTDGGASWSEPTTMAEGAYGWPAVVAPLAGRVHLLWGDVSDGRSWTHRRSLDGGRSWEYQQQVRGLRGVPGPLGVTSDGAGTLHVVGLVDDGTGPATVRYTTWDADNEQWTEDEAHSVPLGGAVLEGAAVAVAGAQGRLDVAFRAEVATDEGDGDEGEEDLRPALVHLAREVAVVEAKPTPAYTPQPTATPTPGPTATPTATPRPTVVGEAPTPAPPTVGMGPLSLPVMAVGGLVVAVLLVVGVIVAQSRLSGRR